MKLEKINKDLSELNFTAIDFETANEKRASICSMGIAVVRKGVIVREEYFLVKPKELRFSAVNSRIHRINEEEIASAQEFNVIWEELKAIFDHEILLAHNAEFDIDVLKQTLELYGFEHPVIRYACTHKLAQEAFDDLKDYRLPDVAAHLGIEINHHNSLADAKTAAEIGIKAIPMIDHNTYYYKYDELTYAIAKKSSATKKDTSAFKGKHLDSHLLKLNLEGADAGNPFYNKKVVFTGDLVSMNRIDAAMKIQTMGADINTSISKQTQIVILGQKAGPAKLKKIEELMSKGVQIRIIEEQEFLSLL